MRTLDLRAQRRVLTFLLGVAIGLLSCAPSASASTTYLRPDLLRNLGGVSIAGAPTVWDAINDDVTELEVPTSNDYVEINAAPRTFEVGLNSAFVPSGATVSGTAWFYTPTAARITLRVAAGPKVLVEDTEFKSSGWHSVAVPLSGSQAQVDELTFRLTAPSSSEVPVIRAAFFRLSVSSPSPKVYWGSWIDSGIYKNPLLGNAPWDGATWRLFEAHARKPTSIVHFGQPVPWEQEFQAGPLQLTREGGSIPLMDMGTGCRIGKICKPGESVAEEEVNRVSLAEINAGLYDGYFEEWAEDVAAYGSPFFFRWAWEMNGTWFKWGRDAAKNPAAYALAWRRFHGIATAAGASNITWVWCPNVDSVYSPISSGLYPGDAYVDWACMDGYNEGGSGWRSFSEVFGPTYNALLSIAPSKPIMIGETASAEGAFFSGPKEVGKRHWITEALAFELPVLYPKIKAINWFNWNIVEGGTERTWPIETSDGAQVAFAAGISSPYYAEDSFKELPPLAKIQPLP